MERRAEIGIGRTKINRNWSAEVGLEDASKRVNGKGLSIHEAIHAVIGSEDLLYVTINPEGNSSGHAKFTRVNLRAAIGPHEYGCGGTGWDMAIARSKGVGGGLGVGSEIEQKLEAIQRVAYELEQKNTLSGSEVRRLINETDNPVAKIKLTHYSGRQTELVMKTRRVKGFPVMVGVELPDEVEDKTKVGQEDKSGKDSKIINMNDHPLTKKIRGEDGKSKRNSGNRGEPDAIRKVENDINYPNRLLKAS